MNQPLCMACGENPVPSNSRKDWYGFFCSEGCAADYAMGALDVMARLQVRDRIGIAAEGMNMASAWRWRSQCGSWSVWIDFDGQTQCGCGADLE